MGQVDIWYGPNGHLLAAPRRRAVGSGCHNRTQPLLSTPMRDGSLYTPFCAVVSFAVEKRDPTSSGKEPAHFVATDQVSRMSREPVNGPSGHFFVSRWPTPSGHPRYTKGRITRSPLLPLSLGEEAKLGGPDGGLDAVRDPQLEDDVPHVLLYGA